MEDSLDNIEGFGILPFAIERIVGEEGRGATGDEIPLLGIVSDISSKSETLIVFLLIRGLLGTSFSLEKILTKSLRSDILNKKYKNFF